MKKILALFLVLAMILTAGLAAADTLEFTPGTPLACDINSFKTYFDLFTGQAGYAFVWNDSAESAEGFEVYSARTEDDTMTMQVFCKDGNISHISGDGAITLDMGNIEDARKFGEWFGASLSGAYFGLVAGEQGPTALNTEKVTGFQTEVNSMMTTVTQGLSDSDKLTNGLACVSSGLDYPVGIELSGSTDGTVFTLVLKICTASPDAQLAVK